MTGQEVLKALRNYQADARIEKRPYQDLQRLTMRFAFEYFFRRLEKSDHQSDFVLKLDDAIKANLKSLGNEQ